MPVLVSFGRSVKNYLENLPTVLGFGLLLFFVFFFMQFSNFFVSSGSVFVFYSLPDSSPVSLGFVALSVGVFLFFYSVFVTLMVFAVRNNLSRVKLQYYLAEKIQKFAFKYFVFLFLLSLFSFLLASAFSAIGIPLGIAFFLLFFVYSALMFVPQVIVVDESSLVDSLKNNLEFASKNFSSVAFVVIIGIALVFALSLIEFVFDYLFFVGNIFSFILAFFFLIPFIETLKTEIYMKKFTLIS